MMTAEQLKASILQMAIQGKLVEQRAEEGTGKELYQKIIEERQQLVKSGRIKKDNVAEESTGEPPFDIPDTWHWATLNDIVSKTIKRGKSPKYVPNSGTLVFAQKCNTKAGYIDLSLCLYLDESKIDKYPEEEFMLDGDIVINSTGNGTLGRVGVYHNSDNPKHLPIVPDSHVTVIRCNKYMNLGFVLYCLRYYQPYMEKLGSGSTNQTELGAGLLKSLYFPIPPIEEQKRIVAKIEELMPFVEQYAKASTRLNTLNASFPDRIKKSILQQAVMGKLVPQDPNDEPASVLLKKIAEEKQKLIKEGNIKKQKAMPAITEDEIPFEIPESWEWVRWGTIAQSIQYGFNAPAQETGRIKMVRISDIQNNQVQWETVPYCEIDEKEISNYLLEENDILFARTGGTVGKSFLVKGVEQEAIYAGYLIRTRYSQRLCPDYLKLFMESDLYWRQLRNGTIATAQPNCNGQTLSKMLIPIPPAEEQNRIASEVQKYSLSVKELHAKAN